MGPYCKYCGNRCFTPLATIEPDGMYGGAVAGVPGDKVQQILSAYGQSTIIATCPEGQRFEEKKVGWCYDKIRALAEVA